MATATTTDSQNQSTTGNRVIPLEKLPWYNFQIVLENKKYDMTVKWNVIDQAWYLNLKGISNTEDIKGIKLVTGPNLIKPFAILDMGGLYMQDVQGEGLDPDYDNIGSRYILLYVPTTNTDYII